METTIMGYIGYRIWGIWGSYYHIPKTITQIRVSEFCPLEIEERRAVSEKACVPKCVPQKQGTFQNCARVAGNCAGVAQNCARVADVISFRYISGPKCFNQTKTVRTKNKRLIHKKSWGHKFVFELVF